MRRPRFHKQVRPVRLGGFRSILFRRFLIDGERYRVVHVTYDCDTHQSSSIRLDLQAEAAFREQNEIRRRRRRLVEIIRRWKARENDV